jgi:hypothetical protein
MGAESVEEIASDADLSDEQAAVNLQALTTSPATSSLTHSSSTAPRTSSRHRATEEVVAIREHE